MKNGLAYRLQFTNVDAQLVTTLIYDTLVQIPDGDTVVIIDLECGGDPCRLSTIDNDEDKFTTIKAKQLTCQFNSSVNYGMNTFAEGPDNRFYVTCDIAAQIVFEGLLMLDDLSEAFLPPRNVVTLVATDKLGALKDTAWTVDDINPVGKYRIAEIIASCLKRTGLTLPIKVINNLRRRSEGDDAHFYDDIYLDAKTFEQEIGISEDCYTVLQKIFGEDCFLTQWNGAWRIMRVDEFDGNDVYVANFDADGVFVDIHPPMNFNQVIGLNEDIYFSQEATVVVPQRPNGFNRHLFNYVNPAEILCNPDFERGDLITEISPEEKHFEIECWDAYQQDFGEPGGLSPASTDIYTRRDYLDGYETARYVVIEANGTPSNLIMSQPVPVNEKDKFSLTVSHRLSADQGGSGDYTTTMAQVRLYGSGGSYYTLEGGTQSDPSVYWEPCTVDFNTNQKTIAYEGNTSANERDTVSKSVEAPPVPVAGEIRILLFQSVFGDTADTYIEPPQFVYKSYTNGTYDLFTGHYNRVDRATAQYSGIKATGYLAARDNEIYLGDAPNKLVKGGLFYRNRGSELHDGSIQFGATGFVLPGNVTANYPLGSYVEIVSASNSGIYRIDEVTYNIIGDTTATTTSPFPGIVVTEAGQIYISTFEIARNFYTAAPFGLTPPPDDTYLHPYGYLQVFSTWNQYFQALSIFQFSIQSAGWGTLPDLLHKYSITDVRGDSVNRNFMMLTFNTDLFLNESNGTMAEVYRTDQGKYYGDVWEIKYTTR